MHYSESRYYRLRSKVVTDAARDSGVPLGVDALSLAVVAHANRSPCLLRVGVATKVAFISRQERRIEEFNPRRTAGFPDFFSDAAAECLKLSQAGFTYIPG